MQFATTDLNLAMEAIDRRFRNGDVSDALTGWFSGRSALRVLDLACGTGANMRALAPILPPDQDWIMLTGSEAEEEQVRDLLFRWAPAAEEIAGGLKIERQGLRIAVRFERHDVAASGTMPDCEAAGLVVLDQNALRLTTSTFAAIANACARMGAVVHARCLYDGRIKLQPHHPADAQMTAALHRRLMEQTPLGAASGPLAASQLAERLELAGYSVIEGPGNAVLKAAGPQGTDGALMRAILSQMAEAQRAVARGHDKMIDTWAARPRTVMEISKTDLVAFPPHRREL